MDSRLMILCSCLFIVVQGSPSVEFNKCGILAKSPDETKSSPLPWMLSIMKPNIKDGKEEFKYHCGGSLIHPSVILTSAHCLDGILEPEKLKAVHASKEASAVRKALVHKNYKTDPILNDVALLFLSSPMKLCNEVRVACVPEPTERVPKNCFIYRRHGDTFAKVELPIVEQSECQSELRSTRLGEDFQLHESFLCAGGVPGKDSCTEDAGSPLVCANRVDKEQYDQVGIVSWGIGCDTRVPGVYTNVTYFGDWIRERAAEQEYHL